MRRDFVFSATENTFNIDLANGDYTVTAIVGENPASETPAPQIFDSGVSKLLLPGQFYTYKVTLAAYNFNKDHAVLYYCQIHPGMVAELTIVP